ncbi:hypothetical protein MK489_20115 [Myxococcota bacterium]|nr:hypothetical protein [Myxococcota bacterium]
MQPASPRVSRELKRLALGLSAGIFGLAFLSGAYESFVLEGEAPRLALSYNWWLKELAANGETERHIQQIRMAADLDHGNRPTSHRTLGHALMKAGRYEEAHASLVESLTIEPFSPHTNYALAQLLVEKGRIHEAIDRLEFTLSVRPGFAPAREFLTNLLEYRSERERAQIEQARAALEASPSDPVRLNLLAWLLATHPDPSLRSPPEALDLARIAAEASDRSDAAILDTLAVAEAANGKFGAARAAGLAALKLARESGDPELGNEIERHLSSYRRGIAPVSDRVD